MENEEKLELETQKIESEIEKEEQFKPITLSDLMKKEFKNPEWLVENLIPAEGITAISGAPASCKTWFVLDLAIKVSTGDIAFDKFATAKGGVLIIDEENGEWTLKRRFQKLQKSNDLPIYIIPLKEFQLTEQNAEKIIAIAKELNIKLVIFDSLVRIHNEDENDAMKIKKVFGLFKRITKNGISVIFTHHNRKQGIMRASNPSQDMRGSSDISASVDCHLAIERKHKEDLIIIHQSKLRQGEEMKPFKLNLITDENDFKLEFAGDLDEIQTKKSDFKEAIKNLLEQEGKPMYKKEVFDTLREGGIEGGYSTFKTSVKEMIESDILFEQKGDKNKMFLSLKPSEAQESAQVQI